MKGIPDRDGSTPMIRQVLNPDRDDAHGWVGITMGELSQSHGVLAGSVLAMTPPWHTDASSGSMGATNRKLEVTCLKCRRMMAWSDFVVSQWRRDGTSRITYGLDGGEEAGKH